MDYRTPAEVYLKKSRHAVSNDDFIDLSAWTDADTQNSVSSATTFQGATVLSQDTNTLVSGNYARLTKDVGTFSGGGDTTISFKTYMDNIGAISGGGQDCYGVNASDNIILMAMRICTDGVFVFDGASYVEVGTNVNATCAGSSTEDCWQRWTLYIDWVAETMDIDLDDVEVGSTVDISFTSSVMADGEIWISTISADDNDLITYTDYISVGTALQ